MRQGEHHLHCVLKKIEYEKLKKDAQKCGLSRSAYLRRLILKKDIKARPPEELKKLYTEINRIGNNINQIARSVNAGIATPEDAGKAVFLLAKVYEKLHEAAKR